MSKPSNVIIKLDMAKSYDRVFWFFLMEVLRKIGFPNIIIDLIWILVFNNWYSVLVNGQSQSFFLSTRNVNQGDPLSLILLLPEVLSKSLNDLFDDVQFVGYGIPKWSAHHNHIAYVDDTIVFTSTDKYSLKKIISTILEYEALRLGN